MEVLKDKRDIFGVDFDKNKEALNKISVIRSKMLKNELAGYITKFIKNELRNEEAKTVQSNAFRVLTEAMKEILTDTNVDLDSTGIKIVSVDASRTVLVHLKLDSKNFEYYFCPNLIIVGISMLKFF